MKITGIIAEYNPFHQGHIYHIQKAKEITQCDCLVVILTGCFSQRGLPSLLTPYDKTKLALQYGANLVLECPVCFGAQSANYFANYNLQALSCLPIDTLCFGSETNDVAYLRHLLTRQKEISADPSKSLNINQNLDIQPNDILGMQYIRYCDLYHIEPVTIHRNPAYKSATQTRSDFFSGKKEFYDSLFLKEQSWDSYYPSLRLLLQMMDAEDLRKIHLVTEGIENRLKAVAQSASNWSSFLEAAITKTYTRARIQRTCLMILLQIKQEEMKETSFYKLKVLGFDSIGQACLKQCDASNIITRFNQMDPFLQAIHQKTWALYNSVLKHPIPERPVLIYDR
ncbi:MAG: nucleotidyltransferase family protein [Faecalicoccus sp.]|uniref:nucleotidyltransferase family protein n=1 Tax=Faecalicoccus sp. TaxID=1971758 RepID=UPI002A90A52C|nr:nucleotidyltransferase family protein [Faecalicoccus sp.]MDY5233040.1 nucleotidyltransferase family protein [Faecalicoccus sp.]